MSNVMILEPPQRTALPRPIASSGPNYVLRRTIALFLVVVVALLLAAAASGLLAGLGGDPASASGAQPASVATYHVAQPGDSLWTIAMEHRGSVALDRYVDRLIALNGGAAIQAGQAVWLP